MFKKSSPAQLRWVLACAALLLAVAISLVLRPSRTRTASPGETPRETPRSELTLREGAWYRARNTSPFTGVMVETYETGQQKSRSEIVNGLIEGLSEGWHTNGQRQIAEHFHKGISHGLRTKWHANGNKLSEVQIVYGKLEGTFRRWSEDGALFQEIEMTQGNPEGVSRAYYRSGFVRTEVRIHDGKVQDQKLWKDGEHPPPPLAQASKGSVPGASRTPQ